MFNEEQGGGCLYPGCTWSDIVIRDSLTRERKYPSRPALPALSSSHIVHHFVQRPQLSLSSSCA